MSKLLAVLLVSLPILLLGKSIEERNGIYLTFVSDITTYRAENPGGLWQPFNHLMGPAWFLGLPNRNDPLFEFEVILNSADVNPVQVKEFLLPPEKQITSLLINIVLNGNDAQVFLVDGGIGQKFASIVVKVPAIERNKYWVNAFVEG